MGEVPWTIKVDYGLDHSISGDGMEKDNIRNPRGIPPPFFSFPKFLVPSPCSTL